MMSADYLTRRWRTESRNYDWIGVVALIAGLLVPTHGAWWVSWWVYVWYAISFGTCLLGRIAQRLVRR